MKMIRYKITKLEDEKHKNWKTCIIDTKKTYKPVIKQFKGFELAITNLNDKTQEANQIFVLEEQNDDLLEFIVNELNYINYDSLLSFAKNKEKFFSSKFEKNKEIGDFGELFFLYKNPKNTIYYSKSMSTNNETLDVNNKQKIEIKSIIGSKNIFELKYHQWEKAKTYAFIRLDKNDDGINIKQLINKIESNNINNEFLNKLKTKYNKKTELQKFLLDTSEYRIIKKEKINLPKELDPSIEDCKIKINIDNIK